MREWSATSPHGCGVDDAVAFAASMEASHGERRNANQNSRGVSLLVGTRKGAWFFHSDAARKSVAGGGAHHLGQVINHLVRDTRSGTLLMAAKTGHLGPTIFRSTDKGKTWKEAAKPPAFPKADGNGRAGRSYVLAVSGT